ncbi:hypothetical protein Tco_0836666 [Tanacetum coccineum]
MESVKRSIEERAQHKRQYDRRVNKRLMKMQKSKVVLGKALDTDLVVMESNVTESRKQDTSINLGNYITHAVNADIRPVNDQVPFAEVDSNTTPDSTNMSHRGGEIDHDVEQYQVKSHLLKAESFAVHEKPNTPRSCLRWKPTGRIFKITGLRWIPTGKMFTDSTTKVDSEPPNGSNDDITNPLECDQTLNVNVGLAPQRKERCTFQCALSLKEEKSSYLRAVLSTTSISSHARSVNKWINYFKPSPNVDHPVLEVPTPVPAASTSSPSSTTVNQDAPSKKPSFEETTLQGVIPSNLHHLNQSFDTLTKLTKKHPLENVIGDPSQPVSIRSQLQEHVIWCYFDANDNPIPFDGKRSG